MLLNGRPTTIFYGQALECSWLAKCQSKWACISLADGKKPLKQVGSKGGCLAEHHQREYQLSSDIYRFQLLIECKRTCKQIWKHKAFLSTCIWGILFKNSYNSIWCDYKTIKLKLININLIVFCFVFFKSIRLEFTWVYWVNVACYWCPWMKSALLAFSQLLSEVCFY